MPLDSSDLHSLGFYFEVQITAVVVPGGGAPPYQAVTGIRPAAGLCCILSPWLRVQSAPMHAHLLQRLHERAAPAHATWTWTCSRSLPPPPLPSGSRSLTGAMSLKSYITLRVTTLTQHTCVGATHRCLGGGGADAGSWRGK